MVQACRTIPDHAWNIIVGHALSCKPGPESYSYRIPGTGTAIFFSSLYKIVGAEFNGNCVSYEELNITQKVNIHVRAAFQIKLDSVLFKLVVAYFVFLLSGQSM